MKTRHFNRFKTLWVFTLCYTFFLGCSNDDNDSIIFNYLSNEFEVSFRTKGRIPAPIMEWPNEAGTFSLKNEISGLVIDGATGEIQWERYLAIGDHNVSVIAESNGKTWETQFLITSALSNTFWISGQNTNTESDEIEFDRSFTFFIDGTLEIVRFSSPDFKGVGVWEIIDNTIEIRFCLCDDIDPFSVPEYDEHIFYKGTLINEETIAYISGQWSVIRFDPDSETIRGNFYMEWD